MTTKKSNTNGQAGRAVARRMIQAGNRIYFARKAADKEDKLRSRNAYRATVGLPLISG